MQREQTILTLIMAGGAGGRMGVLCENRAKPVLPFAGVYGLVDVPLSNCVHSGLSDIWMIEQFQAPSLNFYLANGRPWDLDRSRGGLHLLPPYQGDEESGWHEGNASAIYRNQRLIREFAPDLIVILSADHIYKLDYRHVIAAHNEQGADVTIVTTAVDRKQAARFGNVVTAKNNKVTTFVYKPDEAVSEQVTTEVFVYTTSVLLETIEHLAQQANSSKSAAGATLKDFGHELLPALVERGNVYAYPLNSYWRDVGTIGSYWLAHQELLHDPGLIDLDAPDWPILTPSSHMVPARIGGTAHIDSSWIAPGSVVNGILERAVIGPGVSIEAGAVVRDAIIFAHSVVRAGAIVERAIVDTRVTIGAHARVGGPGTVYEEGDALNNEIAVVGADAHIADGESILPGDQVQPVERF